MAKKDAKQAAKQDSAKNPTGKAGKAPNSSGASSDSESFNASAFAQGTREELAKVIWPTRQQLISESAAVILMVGLSATLIYLVDKLFGWASRQVF
ncbi:MAG: preprotein translocase subunit SecE [Phormidesmis sp.]